jgi:hypothetical protein
MLCEVIGANVIHFRVDELLEISKMILQFFLCTLQ